MPADVQSVTHKLEHHLRELACGFPLVSLGLSIKRDDCEPQVLFGVYGHRGNPCFPDVAEHFQDLVLVVCRSLFLGKPVTFTWSISSDCVGHCYEADAFSDREDP